MVNVQRPSGRFSLGSILWLIFSLTLLILFIQWNEPLRRSTRNLTPLFFGFLFVCSACGFGSATIRLLLKKQRTLLQFTISVAIGLGINALFVFTLGMLRLFHQLPALVWLLAGLVLFTLDCVGWFRSSSRIFLRPLSKTDFFGLGIIAVILIITLPYIVCPETSTDALSYHLLVPKIYLSAGKISLLPLMVESNYPGLAEYNYMLILSFTDEIVCKCFHFFLALLVLITISNLVKKLFPADTLREPHAGSLLAPAFFLSMPVVITQLGWAWNDFFYTLFILLCIYFLVSYQIEQPHQRQRSDLLLAGIMAGLASWTKYTFILFLPVLLLIVLTGIKKWQWKPKALVWLFLPILILMLPWTLKNWMFTGNPFYPFLNSIFRSPYWSDNSNAYFKSSIQNFYIRDWKWYTYVLYPFQLILKPRLADIHTGLVPLLVLPLLFSRKDGESSNQGARVAYVYLAGTVIVWLVLHTGIRTVFPMLALLFAVTAVAAHSRLFRNRFFLTVVAACIIVNLTLSRVNTEYLSDPFRFFIGLEGERDYLKRMSPSQQTYDYLNAREPGAKVLLVSMHQPLYLRQFCYFSGRYDLPVAEVLMYGTRNPAELATKLKRLQIRYIAINLQDYEKENFAGLYTWRPADRQIFQTMISQEYKPVARFGKETIFEWKSSGS